jgi:hypothetical protein
MDCDELSVDSAWFSIIPLNGSLDFYESNLNLCFYESLRFD